LHLEIKEFNILNVVERNQLPIDFRHLETFCRVAHFKSFTKAAEDLCLTQPTVSGQILSLEHALSLRLFDRAGREVRLTKAGEVLHPFASKILSFRSEAINALSEFSQGIRGTLSLGASTIPGEYLIPKLMGNFMKGHPRITTSLKIADTSEIVQYVLEGSAELGLIGAKLNHGLLRYDFFGEDEIVIIGPPDPRRSAGKKIGIEELLERPWIIREEGSGTQMAVEKALKREGMGLRRFSVVMEMGSTSSVKEGVKAGLGLAFVSRIAVEEDLHLGLLSEIVVEGMKPISRQIYIVSRRGRTLSPIGMEFFRFLKEKSRRP
jgi:DNA-binding transcriptional LysR family regulator